MFDPPESSFCYVILAPFILSNVSSVPGKEQSMDSYLHVAVPNKYDTAFSYETFSSNEQETVLALSLSNSIPGSQRTCPIRKPLRWSLRGSLPNSDQDTGLLPLMVVHLGPLLFSLSRKILRWLVSARSECAYFPLKTSIADTFCGDFKVNIIKTSPLVRQLFSL